jgi:SAM-dependent methyltransferase
VRALKNLCGLARGDLLLELGAGTGQLGACFPELGLRYAGLDASAPMLEVFERRLPPGEPRPQLIRTDVDAAWPVASGSVRAVFSSRAVHLFRPEHLVEETLRVASASGATFALGRVQRDERGVRSVLRREMRDRLRARGLTPRDGESGQRRVLDAFRARGAAPLEPVATARWPVRTSAGGVLTAWRGKPGLGGCEPPEAVKAAVLAELETWAADRFGSLDAPDETEERYILEGVVLTAPRSPAETDGTT